MASEKVTEVEMETISPVEKAESEDAEKGKVPETKETYEKGAEGKEKEEKQKEDDPLYSKLKNPTEDIYSLALLPTSPKEGEDLSLHVNTLTKSEHAMKGRGKKPSPESVGRNLKELGKPVLVSAQSTARPAPAPAPPDGPGRLGTADMYVKLCNFGIYADRKAPSKQQDGTDVNKKVTFYRRLSVVLLLISVLLLAVLLALAVKLSEAKSSQQCSPAEESPITPSLCTRKMCTEMYPGPAISYRIVNPVSHVCSECGKGWLKFENSCYLLSRERQTWENSRDECQKLGADLVIIHNEQLQRFLTNKGLMQYWIGLRRSEGQDWAWINNTALTTGYWARNLEGGDCVFLNGGKWPRFNWHSSSCELNSNYICQRG
ncbi:hypothetical protein NFI96_026591 [Prochilodus magdalenae]|nr:hypothetical protein NFI96_026591 [Prochilodus magdalenae]